MPELIIHTGKGKQALSFEGAPVLYDLIAYLPDAPDRACGGNGSCGMCAVMASGSLLPGPDASGKVLSCRTQVTGDAEVWLPSRSVMTQIETSRQERMFELAPVAGEYGAAVDLGTTTIVLELIRLADGKTLATVSCENPQRIVAADVIGRIDSALHGKQQMLQSLCRECIDQLEEKAFAMAGLHGQRADVRVIAGNTTMLYLYTGRSPLSLSAAPFKADCLFGFRENRDYLPSCAGAFVGADITCALLASEICEKTKCALLIDIGTNGEIALWHNGAITCCATAAGPAFEGCGISSGVGSIPGAIDSAALVNGRLSFTTIDNAPAAGICGSGLIDLIAALLDLEELDETGLLEDDVQLAPSIWLTQQDVRQVQLAKAAIAAGIHTLLKQAGISEEEVEALYIAGGFGSHLNLRSAVRIGLFSDALASKAKVLGNASLSGARQLLLSQPAYAQAQAITAASHCINLAASAHFSSAFIECMLFE